MIQIDPHVGQLLRKPVEVLAICSALNCAALPPAFGADYGVPGLWEVCAAETEASARNTDASLLLVAAELLGNRSARRFVKIKRDACNAIDSTGVGCWNDQILIYRLAPHSAEDCNPSSTIEVCQSSVQVYCPPRPQGFGLESSLAAKCEASQFLRVSDHTRVRLSADGPFQGVVEISGFELGDLEGNCLVWQKLAAAKRIGILDDLESRRVLTWILSQVGTGEFVAID
ncbi:MAG: hypothetical protein K1X83_03670 [Oligoflexia bacterium]|nr:hypothetical protein [Oligoflexia bacterium]